MTDLDRLIQIIAPGARLLRTWPLRGGSSAQMTPSEIALPGSATKKLVLRRPGDGYLSRNPQAALEQFKLLKVLHAIGLPTPAPCHLDQSASSMVIEYLDSAADYGPADRLDAAHQLADCLARIHTVEGADPQLSFVSEQKTVLNNIFNNIPKGIDNSLYIDRIHNVLETAWPPLQTNALTLLHGDFWPGNIQWQDARLVAVIDWEDATRGEPLRDLAISRLDLRMIYGASAMTAFTSRYIATTAIDTRALPFWDHYAALRSAPHTDNWGKKWSELGRDDITAHTMKAAYRSFVEQAFETLVAGD